MMPAEQTGEAAERGSSVVEFLLVSVLLLAVFLGVVQIGIVLHTRNVMTAAAAEGARYGANADRTGQDGAQRTRAVLAEALSPGIADRSSVTPGEAVGADGLVTVEITVTGPVPVLLPISPVSLTVRGHALAEGR